MKVVDLGYMNSCEKDYGNSSISYTNYFCFAFIYREFLHISCHRCIKFISCAGTYNQVTAIYVPYTICIQNLLYPQFTDSTIYNVKNMLKLPKHKRNHIQGYLKEHLTQNLGLRYNNKTTKQQLKRSNNCNYEKKRKLTQLLWCCTEHMRYY